MWLLDITLQVSMFMTDEERGRFNQSGTMPSRKPYRTQPLGAGARSAGDSHEAKITDFELNHIFLINKRKWRAFE